MPLGAGAFMPLTLHQRADAANKRNTVDECWKIIFVQQEKPVMLRHDRGDANVE